mmetsp:Transcript_56572/g.133234  ORF Transcript_56572/g.133234 Transcript_56572/m.133234 type:complete len:232 (-) Transcript_56572:390-1085(-)
MLPMVLPSTEMSRSFSFTGGFACAAGPSAVTALTTKKSLPSTFLKVIPTPHSPSLAGRALPPIPMSPIPPYPPGGPGEEGCIGGMWGRMGPSPRPSSCGSSSKGGGGGVRPYVPPTPPPPALPRVGAPSLEWTGARRRMTSNSRPPSRGRWKMSSTLESSGPTRRLERVGAEALSTLNPSMATRVSPTWIMPLCCAGPPGYMESTVKHEFCPARLKMIPTLHSLASEGPRP